MKTRHLCMGLLIFSLALPVVQGCATRMELGVPPRVDHLVQLMPHQSTKTDVLLTLGEPKGYGEMRLRPEFDRQRVWSYEYTLAEGNSIRTQILMVFFSGDTYEGYWWFGDALEMSPSGGTKP